MLLYSPYTTGGSEPHSSGPPSTPASSVTEINVEVGIWVRSVREKWGMGGETEERRRRG